MRQKNRTRPICLVPKSYLKSSLQNYKIALDKYADNGRWQNYPFFVSIETFAKCNAACDFCPYVDIERQGALLSEELFEKIVADLVEADPVGPAMFSLSRVYEPFLRYAHI